MKSDSIKEFFNRLTGHYFLELLKLVELLDYSKAQLTSSRSKTINTTKVDFLECKTCLSIKL